MEILIKVLPALVTIAVGAIGAWKLVDELLRRGKVSLREDYRFARDFFAEIGGGKLNPYVTQIGYQAIAGDSKISSEEAAYMLGLHSPKSAIRDYIFARQLLDFFATAPVERIAFKSAYKSKNWRNIVKYWYVFVYFLTYALSFSPLFFIFFNKIPGVAGLAMFGVTVAMFLPIAFLSLKANLRITRAEALLKTQTETNALRKNL